jgi:hypothetical protein
MQIPMMGKYACTEEIYHGSSSITLPVAQNAQMVENPQKVQGRKISLKKYISQICYPQKVLICADLGTDQKSKDIFQQKKTLFFKLEYFLQYFFTYSPVAVDTVLSTNYFEGSY